MTPYYVLFLDSGLCNEKGVILGKKIVGEVSKKICSNTKEICEVNIKKGTVNSVCVHNCADYCSSFGLRCREMHEGSNGCERSHRYPTCNATDNLGSTSDVICVCGEYEYDTF